MEIRHKVSGEVLLNTGGETLEGALLVRANLRGAYLCGMDLIQAILALADLSEADLSCADLALASLNGADLRGARLRGADLIDADLSDALLDGADLTGAHYDANTRWPEGYDPIEHGAIRMDTAWWRGEPRYGLSGPTAPG